MLDVILDTVIDSLKLLPFLFVTYLVMELLEHHAGAKMQSKIEKAGHFGPLVGGLLGIIPQCGFSAAAASLYSGRAITVGTIIAVFMSTSDEMLPIFISERVAPLTVLKILGAKLLIAVLTGYLVEVVYRFAFKKHEKNLDIETVCEEEHCHCEDGVFLSALKHTLKIFLYILALNFAINVLIHFVGEDTIAAFFTGAPVLGEFIAALVGLIPNCASSVLITQLYLDGIIGAGPLMAGLLVNAGVGLLVLLRLNRNWKENLSLVGLLYFLSVAWGLLIELTGLSF